MIKAAGKTGKKSAANTKPDEKKTPDAPFPLPEDEYGGGDFVSPVQAPPTDDDKPLE